VARQARFLTPASLRWVLRHRAWTPWYLVRYWRFALFKLRNPHVVTEGFVFLGRNVTLEARRGFGRLIIGRWVHIGSGNSIRCHEGTLRIGDVHGVPERAVHACLHVRNLRVDTRTSLRNWK